MRCESETWTEAGILWNEIGNAIVMLNGLQLHERYPHLCGFIFMIDHDS